MEQLKALAATIPTNLMSATSSKFSDLERQLKAKAGSLEEVDAQRKYVAVHSLSGSGRTPSTTLHFPVLDTAAAL